MDNTEFARFPIKLHRVLEMASNDTQLSDVISWLPCGTAFVIRDQLAFSHIVMPVHFASMHSFKSFRRQLNLYGFKKQFNKDSGKREVGGAYGHPLFLRDRSDLAAQISRAPNASKSRRHGGTKALQQDSSACSDHSSSDTMNKGLTFKLESFEFPSTDRMTLTENSISIILAELERNDVLVGARGGGHDSSVDQRSSSDGPTKDNIKATSLTNGTCGMESLFMPYSRQVDVDRDDIRTEIIRTFLW